MQIYLDNAATSHPKPECVLRAAQEAMTTHNANPGRSGHRRALDAAQIVLDAREQLNRLLHGEDPLAFVHTFNCTDALNMAIRGSLRKGDHVVVDALCHNSVLRPVFGLERHEQIGVTVVDPADGFVHDPHDFAREITRRTRLVIVTHVSNVTGAIQPVKEIAALCRRKGVRLLIDGAQAVGAIDVNLTSIGCDLYAFPGHKGLLGPTGTGALYIRPGVQIAPYREGGTGTESDRLFQPDDAPEKYESGTVNLHGIAGLAAGAEFVRKHLPDIAQHEQNLARRLSEALTDMGAVLYQAPDPACRTGVVTFNLPGMTSEAVSDRLCARQIQVRGGLHCAPLAHRLMRTLETGAVRASVGHATTQEEIAAFIAAVLSIKEESAF